MNLISLIKQHKRAVLYIIFGVLTTIINYVAYLILYNFGICSNVVSTILAWVFATIFAFITNKLFVFESRKNSISSVLYELLMFYVFRTATGLVDVLIMWTCVDVLMLNASIFKLVSNVIVIILNYFASGKIIFRKK